MNSFARPPDNPIRPGDQGFVITKGIPLTGSLMGR